MPSGRRASVALDGMVGLPELTPRGQIVHAGDDEPGRGLRRPVAQHLDVRGSEDRQRLVEARVELVIAGHAPHAVACPQLLQPRHERLRQRRVLVEQVAGHDDEIRTEGADLGRAAVRASAIAGMARGARRTAARCAVLRAPRAGRGCRPSCSWTTGARSPWTKPKTARAAATAIATSRAVRAGSSQPKPVTRSAASSTTRHTNSTPTQAAPRNSTGAAARPTERARNWPSGKLSHRATQGHRHAAVPPGAGREGQVPKPRRDVHVHQRPRRQHDNEEHDESPGSVHGGQRTADSRQRTPQQTRTARSRLRPRSAEQRHADTSYTFTDDRILL